MDLEIFQQLSISEVEQYSLELDHAIENHANWLNHINRTLICQLPVDSHEVDVNSHHHCQFGRWYRNINNPALERLPSFQRIGPIHESMHRMAREILLKYADGQSFLRGEYDALIEHSNTLRTQLHALRGDFNRNRDLVSRLMGKVFENADEGVMITAPDTTIISVNSAFSEITGYTTNEVIGKTPRILHSGRQGDSFYRHMWQQLETYGQWQGEIWNRSKAGKDYLEWLSIAAVHDEQGKLSHYIAIFSDITTEKESEERLHNLAHYDQLTGLPNRILFNERLHYALSLAERNHQRVAVMFLDLDGFKPINDNLGHAAGDRLLHMAAQRIKHSLRTTDTVARFGGDEFTIVLPSIDNHAGASSIAEKIIAEIARPYHLEGQQIQITTSIGISLYPDDTSTAHELIHHADHAMYQAKRSGKNRYLYFNASQGTPTP